MKRPSPCRLILLALTLLVTSLAVVPTAMAWSYHTHRKMCSDALNRMPASFIQRFGQYKDRFLQGSTDPDMVIKDFMAHVYHVGGMTRDCRNRVQGLFTDGVALLQGGNSDAETAYTLGLLSHYLADVNQPLHTAGANVDPREDDYHAAFETDVQGKLSRIKVGEIRYDPVNDPLDRLETIARSARPYYESIGSAYRTGNRYDDLHRMVERQYTAAVQSVVDYWLGMMRAAGQPIGAPADPDLLRAEGANPSPQTSPASGRGRDGSLSPRHLEGVGRGEGLAAGTPVDLNTATLDQLRNLPGVGEKKARAIIEARPFTSIYDLTRIQIYGKRQFDVPQVERLSGMIKIGP